MKHHLIPPTRGTLLMIAALVPTLFAGCGGDEDASGVTVVQELRGDTVVMVSSGEPERIRVEAAEVFWQSDEFRGIGPLMAQVGDHLVIGDRYQIHVVSIQGGEGHTVGRDGEGPGEFRSITAVGGFGTDTIAVFDQAQRRVSLFSMEGELFTSFRTTPSPPFTGHTWDSPLVGSGSGVLWEWRGGSPGDNVVQKGLLWHDLEADTAAVLHTWDLTVGTMSPRGFEMPRDVFPMLVVYGAVAPDGRGATGYPADYCIRLFRVFEEDVRKGCRERSRIPVEAGFAALPPDLHPALQVDWEWRNPADLLPHFDRLLFSESGDLWVRLYHEEFAHVHPLFYREFLPAIREWEVFDREAVLVRHVTFPGTFDLRVIGDGEGFGFLTLDTGEVAVGRVDLTGSGVPPT